MLSKTVHLRPLKPSNVLRVKTPERPARLHERNAVFEPSHDYKPIMKTAYDSDVYKFQKGKLAKVPESRTSNSSVIIGYQDRTDDLNICHPANYHLYKRQMYNEQSKDTHNVPESKIITAAEYKVMRSTSQGFGLTPAAERGEEADRRNVYRKNLFISKPTKELNKDFKFQPLVRNAQTTSEDTPYWCQGTSKYYTQDHMNLSNKMKLSMMNLPKADIFGKTLVDHPKQEAMFHAQPPSKGQRYELNKMVIMEKRTEADSDRRAPHVRLNWDENVQKQKYDTKISTKVGSTDQPYVKSIRQKATFDPMVAYKKVGEQGDIGRLKQEKQVDIKIGHPNDSYTYAKKAREDGFYGHQKEIVGSNYQTSSFFCS